MQQFAQNMDGQLPQSVEGTDTTRSVRATIGPDGLPTSLTVEYDWAQNLRPAGLSGAITQACRAAARSRLEVWARAFNDADLPGRAENLAHRIDAQPPAPPKPVPTPEPRATPNGRPANVGALLRELLDATAVLDTAVEVPPAPGVGTAAFGKLSLTLAAGGEVTCTVDPFWASDKTGEELTAALSAALAGARAELAASGPAGSLARVERVLNDAVAFLDNIGRGNTS
jgi:hypothetical protein